MLNIIQSAFLGGHEKYVRTEVGTHTNIYMLYQDLQFCEGLGKDKYCVSTGFVAMLTTVTVSILLKYFNKAEFMAA